jgi:hypothetical protein
MRDNSWSSLYTFGMDRTKHRFQQLLYSVHVCCGQVLRNCTAAGVLTELFTGINFSCWLHYSGFQQTVLNINDLENLQVYLKRLRELTYENGMIIKPNKRPLLALEPK